MPRIFLSAKNVILFFLLIAAFLAVALVIVSYIPNEPSSAPATKGPDTSCVTEVAKMTVRGNSLAPLVNPGDIVTVHSGFYGCNPVRRNDIVTYAYAGNDTPLLKIVKAVPGDIFAFRQATGAGGWHLLINGQVLKNSEGKFYMISRNGYEMLSLYVNDYNGVVPEEAYLLLGNLVSGSLDSTSFGLVGREDILGKAYP